MKTLYGKIVLFIALFLLNASIFPADFFTQDMIEFNVFGKIPFASSHISSKIL